MSIEYRQLDNELYMSKVLDHEQRKLIAGITIEAGYHPVIGKIGYECFSDDPIFAEQQKSSTFTSRDCTVPSRN